MGGLARILTVVHPGLACLPRGCLLLGRLDCARLEALLDLQLWLGGVRAVEEGVLGRRGLVREAGLGRGPRCCRQQCILDDLDRSGDRRLVQPGL